MVRTQLSTVYLAFFVDDMAIFRDDEVLIREINAKLSSHFKMKDMGIMKRFLGLEIERSSFGDVIVSQKRYIERVLERFGMQDCKPPYTPLPTNIWLHKRDYYPDNPDLPADQTLYREIIGSLNHPSQWSRPDVVNAISKLSQYLHNPSVNHLTAAKHLGYFKGTIHFHQIYSVISLPNSSAMRMWTTPMTWMTANHSRAIVSSSTIRAPPSHLRPRNNLLLHNLQWNQRQLLYLMQLRRLSGFINFATIFMYLAIRNPQLLYFYDQFRFRKRFESHQESSFSCLHQPLQHAPSFYQGCCC